MNTGEPETAAAAAAGGERKPTGESWQGVPSPTQHRKGQRYLTVVVDHDSGRLVWAKPGRDKKTVEAFL